jgi:hypothetical protein
LPDQLGRLWPERNKRVDNKVHHALCEDAHGAEPLLGDIRSLDRCDDGQLERSRLSPLPKTELNLLGSGVASYAYRYRVGDGPWSTWQKTKGPEDPEFVLAQTKLGARIAAEVIASADVGEECGEVAMYPE